MQKIKQVIDQHVKPNAIKCLEENIRVSMLWYSVKEQVLRYEIKP